MSDVGDRERWVTVQEAAGQLGKSERTIRRMISSDKLAYRRDGRRLLVNLADILPAEVDKVDTAVEVDKLRAEVDRLTRDNDRLWRQVQFQNSQIATLMGLTEQPAIEAPKERPWWQFWKSD